MSGHSKWATIKRKKGAADAKRGKIFTKLIREITVAAKMGGGDPNMNPRLRLAVGIAKAQNMPNTNIDRAIAKGTGGGAEVDFEEITYEGYGPGGVAMMVEVMTDNRNRTAGEVRSVFSKRGGNLGETGSVRHMFERRGTITIAAESSDEDTLMEIALESGAEDIHNNGDDGFEVITEPNDLETVRAAIEEAGIAYEGAQIGWIPVITAPVSGSQAGSAMRLVEALEDLDDVQNVYANCDIDEETLASMGD